MAAPQDFMATTLTWGNAICLLLGIWLAYTAGLCVQRTWLSPISHIPGPRLAKLTGYYEFYYDVVLGGQFTFKLLELHKVYGPVVRISPWEVHVADHDFHSQLYTGTARPRQKCASWTKQFGAPHSTLATVDHNHHQMRRNALNPFFSTQTVHRLQSVVEERADALLDALVKYAKSHQGKPLNVMYPFSAFTYDVINEYSFSKCAHLIEKEDFGAAVTDSMLKGTHMRPFIKHVSWALTLISCLPKSISGRCMPGWGEFFNMKNGILDQIREIDASLSDTDKWHQDPLQQPTIFHDLLSSKVLPPQEKSPARLAQEGQILVQGGTLTTSWVISLAVFHLLHRPAMLAKLRDELFAAIPDPDKTVPLSQLENLPYLRAVVKESLRLGIGTSGRLPRIATHETLTCTDHATGEEWQLPPGTVVSMSPYMTVMDDSIFYHARGFIPERWLEAAASGDRLDKYLVIFGGGARDCLGMALAKAEVFIALAKLFRRWGGNDNGDRRPGDVGVFKIFEAEVKDCEMASDYYVPIPYKGNRGLRFVLEPC